METRLYEKKMCRISGCALPLEARGLCHTHYMRQRTHGDPNVCKKQKGIGSTPVERFWSRVAKGECWEWQGVPQHTGYGQVTVNGKHWLAHRYSWFLVHNEDPPEMLLHSCDNRVCVNPAHLRKGDAKENMLDRAIRGRSASGERNGSAKLTAAQVDEIRQNVAAGASLTSQALLFRVGASTIRRVVHRRNWK